MNLMTIGKFVAQCLSVHLGTRIVANGISMYDLENFHLFASTHLFDTQIELKIPNEIIHTFSNINFRFPI